MLSYIAGLLLFFSGAVNPTNTFEGTIELIYISQYDTTFFTYHVKKDFIRVDKLDTHHALTQATLINLTSEEIFVLSPARKMYTQIDKKIRDNNSNKNFEIIKTENSRTINHSVCYQWRVKNIERNTEISYWVKNTDFYSFDKFVHLINNVENFYEFYEKIPDSQGFFPVLVEERTLLRAEKSKLSVEKMTPKSLNDNIFKIPDNYEKVNL
ncbi:MAG: hypothetical protein A2X13_11510 [Bacteroidetes bacterium GWC2_33_15]|nr:MAG: hypothetical protein A2X10_05535 [Bacteroidetes bacterium GWA2_33_15]OFX50767.1 MAG: hypothetical protein A2X13_11510 [Bacteroidetes bacterium GWC2_33_15]OFX62951.1 MAG: hypothetical protein A2X15_09860 [Bacteroidetes bacterium GWB2_32_14]OFX70020.1 MAG: hypothetical protein A2X14_02720 [Bacteroidetes bacterium GWD2_33_33]HAN19019.1 hypothetical protein [Bacteroidales bacterium]